MFDKTQYFVYAVFLLLCVVLFIIGLVREERRAYRMSKWAKLLTHAIVSIDEANTARTRAEERVLLTLANINVNPEEFERAVAAYRATVDVYHQVRQNHPIPPTVDFYS